MTTIKTPLMETGELSLVSDLDQHNVVQKMIKHISIFFLSLF